MAARHRPRRHRHPDGGGAPARRRGQHGPPRPGPRGLRRARSGSGRPSPAGPSPTSCAAWAPRCDWSRERFTLDEGLSAAVRKVFVTLHKQKLIYRDKRLVNWDPHFQTAISDLEVEQREVDGHYWHFAYPLEDGSGEIVVATTRPETMLGDTAVAVHPDDERYTAPDRQVRAPADRRPADPDHRRRLRRSGEGLRRGEDHPGPRLQRLPGRPAPRPADDQHPRRLRAHQRERAAEAYRGLDRFVARKKVVEEFEALGLLRGDRDRPATRCRTATAPAWWSSPI